MRKKKIIAILRVGVAFSGLALVLLANNGIIGNKFALIGGAVCLTDLIFILSNARKNKYSDEARERGITATDERGLLINAKAGNAVYLVFMVASFISIAVCNVVKQMVAANILVGVFMGGFILKEVMVAYYRKRM